MLPSQAPQSQSVASSFSALESVLGISLTKAECNACIVSRAWTNCCLVGKKKK